MKKRILRHLAFMDEYLEHMSDESRENLEKTMKKHMTEIYFFMHERFIHLVVTVLFALGTFMTIFTYLLSENIGLVALGVLMIVLLVPYVNHYYLLENGVQKMYVQYDELLAEIERREEEERKSREEHKPESKREEESKSENNRVESSKNDEKYSDGESKQAKRKSESRKRQI